MKTIGKNVYVTFRVLYEGTVLKLYAICSQVMSFDQNPLFISCRSYIYVFSNHLDILNISIFTKLVILLINNSLLVNVTLLSMESS